MRSASREEQDHPAAVSALKESFLELCGKMDKVNRLVPTSVFEDNPELDAPDCARLVLRRLKEKNKILSEKLTKAKEVQEAALTELTQLLISIRGVAPEQAAKNVLNLLKILGHPNVDNAAAEKRLRAWLLIQDDHA